MLNFGKEESISAGITQFSQRLAKTTLRCAPSFLPVKAYRNLCAGLLACGAGLAWATAANANLLFNGNFETTSLVGTSSADDPSPDKSMWNLGIGQIGNNGYAKGQYIYVKDWSFACIPSGSSNPPPGPGIANLCGKTPDYYAYITNGDRVDFSGSYSPQFTSSAGTGPGANTTNYNATTCGRTPSSPTGGFMTIYGPRNCFTSLPVVTKTYSGSLPASDFASPSGGKFLAFDGEYGRGKLTQSVNLKANKTYKLSFEYAFAQQYNPYRNYQGSTVQKWYASIDGNQVNSSVAAYDLATQDFSGWKTFSGTYTTGSSDKTVDVSFGAYGRCTSCTDSDPTPADNPPFLLLDNIVLQDTIPAPLPLAGALPLGVALRKLSRKRAILLARR